MKLVQHGMRRASDSMTRLVGLRYGASFPFYYISEYPKSGGTWLSRMVADALQLPFPQHAALPLGFSCVVQNHWTHHPRMSRAIYLYRDGRDIMVSYFFHRLRIIQKRSAPRWGKIAAEYDRIFGKGYDPEDTKRLLPRFIENEFARPRGCRTNWRDHVDSWMNVRRRAEIAYVSYEELLSDCGCALSRVTAHVSGKPVEGWRIDMAVEKFSMRRQTGRTGGTEDRSSFIRKGVAGDWRNHFTRESAQVFDDLAGDVLLALGYERDRSWVEMESPSPPPPARSTDKSLTPVLAEPVPAYLG